MTFLRSTSAALILLTSIGAASAATIQDSRGTFIQDRNGVWQEYIRVQPRLIAPPVDDSYNSYVRDDWRLPPPLLALDVAGTNDN